MAVNPPGVPTPFQQVLARREWRAELEREYGVISERLQGAYNRVLPTLRTAVNDLNAQLGAAYAANGELSPQMVREMRAYVALLERVDAELRDFAVVARNIGAEAQQMALPLGLQTAESLVGAQLGNAAQLLGSVYMRPDPNALANLISIVDSQAFRERAGAFGVNAAQNVSDVILSLVAQGKGSDTIARAMETWLGVPYAWAENSVRTATLYSYRLASHASYRANERVVQGWVWQATLDSRTCVSCLSMHGTRHSNDETLNDHHRGRCTPIPVVIGTTWADNMQSGETWFNAQSEGDQRAIMGNRMYEAYRGGQFAFGDLSRTYEDAVYGTMRRAATLGELGVR